MEAILERNGDHQTVEPWHDSIRYHAENIVKDGQLPVTTEGLYNAVGITEVKDRNQHNAERIRNVMKALEVVQQCHLQRNQVTRYFGKTAVINH